MSEPAEVEARFGSDGEVSVLRFTWGGHWQPAVSHGRRWEAPDGYHCLVMAPGERIFELVFNGANHAWRAAPVAPPAAKA